MSGIEQALELARVAEPPPISDAQADAWVQLGLREADRASASHRAPGSAPRHVGIAVAATLAIAASFLLGWWMKPSATPVASVPAAPQGAVSEEAVSEEAVSEEAVSEEAVSEAVPAEISRVALPSGDTLHAAAGARYEVLRLGPARRLAVQGGTVLFDVAPGIGAGRSFTVESPHGEIVVQGTVFTVQVEGGRTVVRVYEGRVLVRFGESVRILGAREAIAMGAEGWSVEPAPAVLDDAMARVALGASARRASLGLTPGASAEPLAPYGPAGQAEPSRAVPFGAVPSGAVPSGAVPSSAVPSTPAGPAPVYGNSIPRPAFVRRWIADGQADRARATAERAIAEGFHAPTWRMVEGDALRVLDRPSDAARSYELAARGYGGALAARAALRCAELRLGELHDPAGARDVLDRYARDPEPDVAARVTSLRDRIAIALGAAGGLGAPR